ncbi:MULTISPECIES: plasmid partitioning/stability family protein [Pectobacterium]|uniref:plasmid partitioning/stability family protein n=1 Tax=Pectobacterium TaxID=122277 RepID=UPI00050245BA|nr:plasmid partitioning/stability family protein [Pectobacterium atrosepticum]KFX11047.1 plasmid stability protein [Pectobacterium atrosepticum]KMK87603.1 plasmid stability and maintenance protein [Pectobacterium atrosepticum ICMP 1526]QXE13109.1 plasmid stability protein [Pectobacterium atrosepticum]
MADGNEERKKFNLYLHPDGRPDQMALAEIETVPRKSRGDLYREALISGLVLHHLDSRIPAVLTSLFTKTLTVDQVINQIAQITGWTPSLVAVRDVLAVLGDTSTSLSTPEKKNEEDELLKVSREKLKGLM